MKILLILISKKEKGIFTLIISDNGIGFNSNKKGFGMELINNLVLQLQGSITQE